MDKAIKLIFEIQDEKGAPTRGFVNYATDMRITNSRGTVEELHDYIGEAAQSANDDGVRWSPEGTDRLQARAERWAHRKCRKVGDRFPFKLMFPHGPELCGLEYLAVVDAVK